MEKIIIWSSENATPENFRECLEEKYSDITDPGEQMMICRQLNNEHSECMSPKTGSDICSFYLDENDDFIQKECHHDGTNYYTYLAWKDDITEDEKDAIHDHMFDMVMNKATASSLMKYASEYTKKLGPIIREVYGVK